MTTIIVVPEPSCVPPTVRRRKRKYSGNTESCKRLKSGIPFASESELLPSAIHSRSTIHLAKSRYPGFIDNPSHVILLRLLLCGLLTIDQLCFVVQGV